MAGAPSAVGPGGILPRFAIAHALTWSPDASFRERDQELGAQFAVSVFAPDGTLTELPVDVLRVLAAFGTGATAADVTARLGLDTDDVAGVEQVATTLAAHGFLRPAPEGADDVAPAVPPTFLVAAHGCGGTLLRLFIDAHERVACASPHRFGNCLRDMIDRCSQTDAFASLELDKPTGVRSLGAAVASLLTLHARLRQKDGWVWASRDHDLCLEFLDDLFEDGRFVCLVRHPLDAADSSARRYEQEGWHATRLISAVARYDDPRLAYVHYWAEVYRRVRAFADARPERVLIVRYEDLVRDTEKTLASVFEFIGLSLTPSLVTDAFKRPRETLEGGWESTAFDDATAITYDQIGLWASWDDDVRRRVGGIVEDELGYWGYALTDR